MTAPRSTAGGGRHQIPAGSAHTRTMRLVFADQANEGCVMIVVGATPAPLAIDADGVGIEPELTDEPVPHGPHGEHLAGGPDVDVGAADFR